MSCATVRHCRHQEWRSFRSLIKCVDIGGASNISADSKSALRKFSKHTGTPYPAVTLMCRSRKHLWRRKYNLKTTEASNQVTTTLVLFDINVRYLCHRTSKNPCNKRANSKISLIARRVISNIEHRCKVDWRYIVWYFKAITSRRFAIALIS